MDAIVTFHSAPSLSLLKFRCDAMLIVSIIAVSIVFLSNWRSQSYCWDINTTVFKVVFESQHANRTMKFFAHLLLLLEEIQHQQVSGLTTR